MSYSRYQIGISGKHCVIIGRSNIVGKPLAGLLLQEDATVTICHSKTKNLKEITRTADILISAIGKPGFIDGTFIKPGVIVIDVGTTRVPDSTKKNGYRLSGDVNFEKIKNLCSFITPVPGGRSNDYSYVNVKYTKSLPEEIKKIKIEDLNVLYLFIYKFT